MRDVIESDIYYVGDDEPISTNELIGFKGGESVGKRSHIWRLPKGLMGAAGSMGSVLHLPLNTRLKRLKAFRKVQP